MSIFDFFKKGDSDTHGEPKPAKIGKVESLESFLLVESGMRGSVEYEIEVKDGKALVSEYRMFCVKDGMERRLEDQCGIDVDVALSKLNEFGIGSWNGFHGAHPKHVQDGIMFRLEAKVNGGTELKAEGSANFPSGYHGMKRWICDVIRNNENV